MEKVLVDITALDHSTPPRQTVFASPASTIAQDFQLPAPTQKLVLRQPNEEDSSYEWDIREHGLLEHPEADFLNLGAKFEPEPAMTRAGMNI